MSEQTLIQFRVDKELKQDVSELCEELGMDLPTVFRMCMKQMLIARGIPFPTRLPVETRVRQEALSAFEQLRRQAADLPEMSVEEIDEEIRAARENRRKDTAQ